LVTAARSRRCAPPKRHLGEMGARPPNVSRHHPTPPPPACFLRRRLDGRATAPRVDRKRGVTPPPPGHANLSLWRRKSPLSRLLQSTRVGRRQRRRWSSRGAVKVKALRPSQWRNERVWPAWASCRLSMPPYGQAGVSRSRRDASTVADLGQSCREGTGPKADPHVTHAPGGTRAAQIVFYRIDISGGGQSGAEGPKRPPPRAGSIGADTRACQFSGKPPQGLR